MGFGFNLFFVFILLPLTLICGLIWLFTRKRIFVQFIGVTWILILSLVAFTVTMEAVFGKRDIKRDDLYGEYIIDRSKFPGKQADWQYSHFRFLIARDNKFYFYLIENGEIVKLYTSTVSFLENYVRPRLILQVETPAHHIIEDNPTLYYTGSSFYYVFNSAKFGNVFFVKGEWKPIDK